MNKCYRFLQTKIILNVYVKSLLDDICLIGIKLRHLVITLIITHLLTFLSRNPQDRNS